MTPGPWRIEKDAGIYCGHSRSSGAIIGSNGNRVIIADPSEGEYEPAIDLDSEDARLIAAAPDLLEALERMVHTFGKPHRDDWMNDEAHQYAVESWKQGIAAIAKATQSRDA